VAEADAPTVPKFPGLVLEEALVELEEGLAESEEAAED